MLHFNHLSYPYFDTDPALVVLPGLNYWFAQQCCLEGLTLSFAASTVNAMLMSNETASWDSQAERARELE